MSMNEELNTFIRNLSATEEAYKSWGKVKIINIVTRDGTEIHFYNKIADAIFTKRKNINFVIITRQEYASEITEEIPPILDDQAQLLGVSVRVAKTGNAKTETKNLLQALQGRYAAIYSDGRCICLGATIDDAYVAAQLLEKTSKAFTEAKWLGGAKSINRFEAWAMQMYYQFKYAKEAKKNR